MATTFFTIDNKTNLHAGSGKSNYGVIDQLVQRDPTFQFPTIHASSLKGGIKEFFHYKKFTEMVRVFGSDKDTNGKSLHDNSQVGEYKFFDAMLLTLPVRSDKRAFIHITCPAIIQFCMIVYPQLMP
ncbi:MAG: type III-B CRISPR module RAMP protein Cmr4 [Saprospiraceae bacterium]|nr:type III-B CRISPR module RAMP protein Cmr4 [Saprospiraceae bacterium]